jgi:hypothetical protein
VHLDLELIAFGAVSLSRMVIRKASACRPPVTTGARRSIRSRSSMAVIGATAVSRCPPLPCSEVTEAMYTAPSAILGRTFSLSPGWPNRTSVSTCWQCIAQIIAVDRQPAASREATAAKRARLPPRPPYSSGTSRPIRPHSRSADTDSTGNRASRSTTAACCSSTGSTVSASAVGSSRDIHSPSRRGLAQKLSILFAEYNGALAAVPDVQRARNAVVTQPAAHC